MPQDRWLEGPARSIADARQAATLAPPLQRLKHCMLPQELEEALGMRTDVGMLLAVASVPEGSAQSIAALMVAVQCTHSRE